MGTVVLIRHTSVDVPAGTIYGQTDVLPDRTFAAEAEKLKSEVRPFTGFSVFSSPLTRCRMLAEALFPGREIHFDQRITELDFGNWESRRWEEIEQLEEGRYWFDRYQTVRCPGGEGYPDLYSRVRDFLICYRKEFAGGAVIITHGGPFRVLAGLLKGMSAEGVWDLPAPPYGGLELFELE
ncbi:histidine phosphatase family protein [Prolixibacter sp. NT017]|uniref:histidine phosphatase family protein n=1 Tax=Prolixibacter sp. NT017 TaxID=2652390 RepID=UPI00126E57FC|nr:histidine phosphatase family protein [Prolixibacter sp. NT017]GET25642.1 hypothetical protein NT017_19710 [Prolixibacter sp. NT017]